MLTLDIFFVAAIIGILATAGGAVIKAINLIRYIEGKIEAIQANQNLQKFQIDSALKLLDLRVRDLERYTESKGFKTHHEREDQTGSPFLNDL